MNEIIIGVVSAVAGGIAVAILGNHIGWLNSKKLLKRQEFLKACNVFREPFINLIIKLRHEKLPYNISISDIIKENLSTPDFAIERLRPYINNIKSKQINEAFDQLKVPCKNIDEGIRDSALKIYDFDKSTLKEIPETQGFETGKDLAIHNLQNIIDLVK
ncbi:MAG: hypothetical protein KAW92_06685 [Candidatus Cloacimonetes bacterium]|nr:hypothetical protein [Candidatus Cloacimonadota bacterium]